MNNWQKIHAFYARVNPEIMAAPSSEWAIDPYAWDVGILEMTPIEAWLWSDIRAAGAVMYPQYPVAGVFVDFGNPVAKVAIECDGAAYHQDKQKDAARDALLSSLGWTVYRITGSDCRKEMDEETRDASPGARLIRRICQSHRVCARNPA